jgi:hypothetical protein
VGTSPRYPWWAARPPLSSHAMPWWAARPPLSRHAMPPGGSTSHPRCALQTNTQVRPSQAIHRCARRKQYTGAPVASNTQVRPLQAIHRCARYKQCTGAPVASNTQVRPSQAIQRCARRKQYTGAPVTSNTQVRPLQAIHRCARYKQYTGAPVASNTQVRPLQAIHRCARYKQYTGAPVTSRCALHLGLHARTGVGQEEVGTFWTARLSSLPPSGCRLACGTHAVITTCRAMSQPVTARSRRVSQRVSRCGHCAVTMWGVGSALAVDCKGGTGSMGSIGSSFSRKDPLSHSRRDPLSLIPEGILSLSSSGSLLEREGTYIIILEKFSLSSPFLFLPPTPSPLPLPIHTQSHSHSLSKHFRACVPSSPFHLSPNLHPS